MRNDDVARSADSREGRRSRESYMEATRRRARCVLTTLIRFRRERSIPSVARPGEGCNVVLVGKAANFRGFCTQGTEGRYKGYQAVPGKTPDCDTLVVCCV